MTTIVMQPQAEQPLQQIKVLINQCNLEQKIELVKLLNQETFATRFTRLLQDLETDDLNLEEITAEVEAVRMKRYQDAGCD